MLNPSTISLELEGLESTWADNELSTLLSSSRTEMTIRDKFTLHFQRKFGENGDIFAVREWKRVDLALIERIGRSTSPAALFEFKARHSAFIADRDKGRRGGLSGAEKTFYGDGLVKNGVQQDVEKLRRQYPRVPGYNVLIGVHPLARIPERYTVFTSDCPDIGFVNKSFDQYGGAEKHAVSKMKAKCFENVESYCDEQRLGYVSKEYGIGTALGVQWEIIMWIMFRKPDNDAKKELNTPAKNTSPKQANGW